MFAAGAVGVIVVSLILAFSNGLNTYITDMQNTTLAQYPITFDQTRDLQKVDSDVKAEAEKTERAKTEYETKSAQREKAYQEARANDRVFLNNRIGAMMSTSGESTTASSSSTVNDLYSLKKYLDTNPDNFNDYIVDIEYAFRTSPVIYSYTWKWPHRRHRIKSRICASHPLLFTRTSITIFSRRCPKRSE